MSVNETFDADLLRDVRDAAQQYLFHDEWEIYHDTFEHDRMGHSEKEEAIRKACPVCVSNHQQGFDTPEYLAFVEEQEAIHEGRAVELMHCYLCEPDVNKRMEENAGPLRGILARGITNERQDPTETYHLIPCGHWVI